MTDMRRLLIAAATLVSCLASISYSNEIQNGDPDHPNVIMIAVDDMNAWLGPLGDQQAITPNLDRLAARGVTFTNAHTAGIYCAPSRAAIFTGRLASTTGCYDRQVYFYEHPEYRPLQKAFQDAGYSTYGTGKLFHHPAGMVDLRGWTEFKVRTQEQRESGWPMDTWEHGAPLPDPYPGSPYNQTNPNWTGRPFMEIGSIPNDREEEMADTRRANWVCDLISKKHDKPFFVGLGFYAPHYPNYAPQKYFDLYPISSIQRPPWKEDDLDDIPDIQRKPQENRKKSIHGRLLELGIVDETIQAYLACISYADAMVGRVLDALEMSPNKDNTVIVFWSDHGYHHGQKGNWGKHTLWRQTSHVPFIWAGPRIAKGEKVEEAASLVDLYATLVDHCNLKEDPGLEGASLSGILGDPDTASGRSVVLPYDVPESYAVVSKDWRYIRYEDGSEELYDLNKDPEEWRNLANDPEYAAVKKRLKSEAPKSFAPLGTQFNNLRIVVDGESFRWSPKR